MTDTKQTIDERAEELAPKVFEVMQKLLCEGAQDKVIDEACGDIIKRALLAERLAALEECLEIAGQFGINKMVAVEKIRAIINETEGT